MATHAIGPEVTGTALGAFYVTLTDPADRAPVFGAGVAARAFMQALLRHGRFDRMEFFAPAVAIEKARAEYHACRRTDPSCTRVRLHRNDSLEKGLDVLVESEQQGGV
jgi:hypothetical protein